jgi:hypothetical protein
LADAIGAFQHCVSEIVRRHDLIEAHLVAPGGPE